MSDDKFIPIVEAMLFASGEPLEIKQISKVLNLNVSQVEIIIGKLVEKLKKNNSGISIIKLNNKYQMCSNPDYSEYIKDVLKINQSNALSSSAMEVLAIIAYNEPVTKSFIQNIRGVDCSKLINNLIEKSLIKETGRLDIPGKPIIYSTTETFLRCFGLSSINDLPEVSNEGK